MKKVLQGKQARLIIPELNDDSAYVIASITDTLVTNKILGHLIYFNGTSFETRNDRFISRPLTELQIKSKIKGAFLFIGTNADFWHHLIYSRFSGKVRDEDVILDKNYNNLISREFCTIIFQHIKNINV